MQDLDFQIIGFYDNRRTTATYSAATAHEMVKHSKQQAGIKISKPRKPKARSIDEIRDRAVMMGVKFELEGKTIYLTPSGTSEYRTTTKANAWATLDEISAEIMATLSDDQIRTEAEQALALIF
jgi:hypothetical protein